MRSAAFEELEADFPVDMMQVEHVGFFEYSEYLDIRPGGDADAAAIMATVNGEILSGGLYAADVRIIPDMDDILEGVEAALADMASD